MTAPLALPGAEASRQARRSLIAVSTGAVGVATVTVLPLSLVGALAVQVSGDLAVSTSALGAASSAFFGAGTLVSPLAGAVVERVGARAAMRMSLLLVGSVLVAIGTGAHSLPVLLGLLALGGAGNALAQPATNLYLAQRVVRRRQGTAYGVKQSAIPASGLLAGLAVPALGLTVGWRWAFVLFALPAIALALRIPGGAERPDWPVPTGRPPALPRKVLLVIAFGAGLGAACGSTLAIFLVAGAVDAGWSEAQAGLVFAAASATGVLARVVSGVRADRRDERHLEVMAAMLLLGALGFVGLATGQQVLYALGALVAFGLGWGWPGLLILSVVQMSPASPAAATALTQVGTSGGAVVGPLAFGILVERTSYSVGWGVAGAGLALAAVVFLLARRLPAAVHTAPDPPHAHLEMLMTTSRQLVLDYFAACSGGDAAAITAAFCKDAVVYDTNHRPVSGAVEIGRFYAKICQDRRGASWHVDTFLGDDEHAATEWTMLDPREGDPVAVRGSEHYEFRDGRISQIRQYWRFDPNRPEAGLRGYPYGEDARFTLAGRSNAGDAVGGRQ